MRVPGARSAKREHDRHHPAASAGSIPIYAAGREIAQLQRTEGPNAPADKIIYLHDDALGSTNVMTGASGLPVGAAQRFQPFGKSESPQSGTGVLTGFTGHQSDADLGLVNMRGRIYDPIVGRFTTPDPFVQAPFWSQGLNRYSYAFNNPMKWVDPSGFDGEEEVPTQDLPEMIIVGNAPLADPSYDAMDAGYPADATSYAGTLDYQLEQSELNATSPNPAGANASGSAGQMSTEDFAPRADSTQSSVATQFLAPAPSNLIAQSEFRVTDTSGTWRAVGTAVNVLIPAGEGGGLIELGVQGASGALRSAGGLLTVTRVGAAGEVGAAGRGLVTVTHFTGGEGFAAIAEAGALRAGTFVALPSEVSGLTAAQVESTLEIQAGRGAFSVTFETAPTNLVTPFNGPLTSGGATQFQLLESVPIAPGSFVPTP